MNSDPDALTQCRLGVLAFGDSITNGGGELQWGVALHSWALWTARGLGLPYTGYAVDGARITDVVGRQIPAYRAQNATAQARYDVGCLYIGVNDVRDREWDHAEFEAAFGVALGFLAERCDRVLTATAPLGLGLPPAAPQKVSELNAVIERVAREQGALVLDLRSFGARNRVMADRVHPTALGQIAMAERALELLARDGRPTRVNPVGLISFQTTRRGRLRGDLTYAYRSLKLHARAAGLRFLAGRSGGR